MLRSDGVELPWHIGDLLHHGVDMASAPGLALGTSGSPGFGAGAPARFDETGHTEIMLTAGGTTLRCQTRLRCQTPPSSELQ